MKDVKWPTTDLWYIMHSNTQVVREGGGGGLPGLTYH